MTWVRIDDSVPENTKFSVPDDENAALALWFRALMYSSRMRTGAFIKEHLVLDLSRSLDPMKVAEDLVSAGLWTRRSDGFIILGGGEMWSRYSDGYWSKSAYATVYARDLATCRYCGSVYKLTIDHVVPRCQDGGDSAENLVVACWSCNRRKRGRTPEQAGMPLRPVPEPYAPRKQRSDDGA